MKSDLNSIDQPCRFQVSAGGWAVQGGAILIPPGTVLSKEDWTYLGIPLPTSLPPNLIPLDQAAYDEMARQHRYHVIVTLEPTIAQHAHPKHPMHRQSPDFAYAAT